MWWIIYSRFLIKMFHFLGCAFLTYYDKEAAQNAQDELHEKKTLPGVRHFYSVCNYFCISMLSVNLRYIAYSQL